MKESLGKLKTTGEVYRLLSRAYYAPEENFLKGDFLLSTGKAFEVLNPELISEKWAALVSYLECEYEPTELALEYTRLFRGPVKAEAYPYESMHIDGEAMGASTLDVLKRYEEAGVAIAETFNDLPDHISAELEFMHYLCGRELDALQRGANDEATRFQHMRQAFLRDHLDKWVPLMCKKIHESGTTHFYGSLADITEGWIRHDHAWVGSLMAALKETDKGN